MNKSYQLKIELAWIEPAIWRRLIVPEEITLDRLHDLVQIVMGWMDYHMHEFNIEGVRYTENQEELEDGIEESEFCLNKLISKAGKEFTYTYDFGDDWLHRITVEKILNKLPADVDQIVWCLDGKRNCPPEDIGGAPGYEVFCDAIRDKSHPEHKTYTNWYREIPWYSDNFDSEAFDLSWVNRELGKYLRWSRPRSQNIGMCPN